ncbi:MAG: phosphoribosylglycinamide formyltransferase [Actinomycetes bacterium]|nr:phosphoribosylglycinamide formyltransferase [Candidatus Nanopelagicales bacterium]
MTARVVVLASGSGTLMQALVDAGGDDFVICAVISDRTDAVALDRARNAQVPAVVVSPGDFTSRAQWNTELADAIGGYSPDWIVCAGFMRILGKDLVDRFSGRIVNSHPALLPAFAGAHAVRDALTYGVAVSGCTIHLVDAGVDTGPIIAQEPVIVLPDDDEASLHERIKVVERQLLLRIIRDLSQWGCTVTGRKVSIP